MAYIKIGGAYFQDSPTGLQAVSSQGTLQGLSSGSIPYTTQASFGTQTVAPAISAPVASTPAPQPSAPPVTTPTQYTLPTAPTPAQYTLPAAPTFVPYTPQPMPTLPDYSSIKLPERVLPPAPATPDLSGFANALDYAMKLAGTQRNELIGQLSEGNIGPASGMNGIVNSLNRASINFSNQQTSAVANQFQNIFKAQQDAYEKAYDLAVNDYDFQRALAVDNVDAQRDIILKYWDAQNQASQYNNQGQNNAAQDYYNNQVKVGMGNTDIVNTAAQDQYQNQVDASKLNTGIQIDEKNSLQTLALELAKDGAPTDIVNAVINSGSYSAGVSISSGYLEKKSKNTIKLEQVGSTLYQLTMDKDGAVIDKKVVVQGTDGGGGGSPTTTVQTYSSTMDAAITAGATPGEAVIAAMATAKASGQNLSAADQTALLAEATRIDNLKKNPVPSATVTTPTPRLNPDGTRQFTKDSSLFGDTVGDIANFFEDLFK